MKKLFCIVMVIVMAVLTMSGTVFASGTNYVTIHTESSATTVGLGGTISITLVIDSNPGVAYMNITPIVYNADIIWNSKNTQNGGIFTDMTPGKNIVLETNDAYNTYKTGALITLEFEIAEDAVPGDYGVQLVINECYDENLEDVMVIIPVPLITIECFHEDVLPVEEEPALCTTSGYTAGVYCNDCKTYISGHEQIAALGHDYETIVKAPGCLEGGYTTYTCSACGDSYTGDETEPTGHNYESIVTAPGCLESGYTTHTCSGCGNSYTGDETEPTGHNYESVVTAPGCVEGGYTTYTCDRCGDSYTGDETEAVGHSYENTVTEPTCTEKGYTASVCAACGDRLIHEETPATGHSYEDVITAPTCDQAGYTTHICSVCGDSYTDAEVAAQGHSYESVVTDPSCTEPGFTTHTCAVCGHTYTDAQTAATGHSFGEWTETKAPTCAEEGEEVRSCACGETETRVIQPTGAHTYGDWQVTKEATRKETGEEIRTCSCGASETRQIPMVEGMDPIAIVAIVVGVLGVAAIVVLVIVKKRG